MASVPLLGIAAYPPGNTIYVTNQSHRTVSVIDTRTDAIAATIPVGAEPPPTTHPTTQPGRLPRQAHAVIRSMDRAARHRV